MAICDIVSDLNKTECPNVMTWLNGFASDAVVGNAALQGLLSGAGSAARVASAAWKGVRAWAGMPERPASATFERFFEQERSCAVDFGSVIKRVRRELGLTQDEMGAKLGVTRQAVSNWENDRNLPDIEMLVTMARTFDLSLDELILGGKDMNNMTQKLIDDGSDVRKTRLGLMSACLGATLLLLGAAALAVNGAATYVDADGMLHENGLTMMLGFVGLFGGFTVFLGVGARSLAALIKGEAGSRNPATLLAAIGFSVFAVGVTLFMALTLAV